MTPSQQLKESLEEFDKEFCKLRSDNYMELVNLHAPDLKAFIKTHTIKLLQAEIEREQKVLKEELEIERFAHKDYHKGFESAKQETISHLQEQLIKIKEYYEERN